MLSSLIAFYHLFEKFCFFVFIEVSFLPFVSIFFMGFRIANIHEYTRFLAIDLWSYRVRASVYSLDDGHLVHEKSSSVKQSRKNFLDGTITDMQGVALVLERAIHEACSELDEMPEDIIIGFSPSISIHDSTTSQYIRSESESPITMDEIDMMIEKIEAASLVRAREKARREHGLVHDDIRLISSTLTSILIDGKRIANPIGFRWSQLRITVLNVFALASEYNILRSIVSSLKKDIISLVPMPLLFPKMVEISERAGEDAIYVDIGYMHTTIVLEKRWEIGSFETFSLGTKMLLDMLSRAYPKSSYTEIENLLVRAKCKDEEWTTRDDICKEFFAYIIDMLLSLLWTSHDTHLHHVILSGGISETRFLADTFFSVLREKTRYDGSHSVLSSLVPMPQANNSPVTHALALLAQELLYTKKDPLIRILRYALYHYE